MGKCRVIDYTNEWREGLRAYMKRTFPLYSEEYINYCLDHSSDRVPSLIVVNDEGVVVGCHLYFCTKVLINGEEIDTQWGHDTFLDIEYRKDIGVDFMLRRKKIVAFGLGLSEVNRKIRKLMKTVFLEGVYNYYILTPYFLLSLIQKVFNLKVKVADEDYIDVKKRCFKRVFSVHDICIPNGGFWFKGYKDIDFIRDADFLETRFFKSEVYNYKVYASEDSYFIVRDALYHGIPALMLSDFRYNPQEADSLICLMKAVKKLAIKSQYGIVYFVCGDKRVDDYFRYRIKYKTKDDFISSHKISPESTFILTGGDSDADFVKLFYR